MKTITPAGASQVDHITNLMADAEVTILDLLLLRTIDQHLEARLEYLTDQPTYDRVMATERTRLFDAAKQNMSHHALFGIPSLDQAYDDVLAALATQIEDS